MDRVKYIGDCGLQIDPLFDIVEELESQLEKVQEEADRRTREIELTYNVQRKLNKRIEELESQLDKLEPLPRDIQSLRIKLETVAGDSATWQSNCEKAEAQLEQARVEYLNHVKATKSPAMVLNAIGWIIAPTNHER